MRQFSIINADVLDGLHSLPDASFHACFCDPPYGLSFMGKSWDHGIPGAEVWAEVLRVLKPGAPLLAFGGTRTYHRLACAIEDGGFAIADTLCWLYGSGFPKGHAQLKPAWEPITLAWKKGKRVLAIDAARVPSNGESFHRPVTYTGRNEGWERPCQQDEAYLARERQKRDITEAKAGALGRWPANVLLDEDAAAALDAQSGVLVNGGSNLHSADRAGIFGVRKTQIGGTQYAGDSGGASRFFYIAKADSAERGDGNLHPCVKPVDLCAYLSKLILTGASARLLVPFSGSGSEIMGALRAGWAECVGVEKEPEYVELSRRRIIGDAPMFNTELVLNAKLRDNSLDTIRIAD